MRRVRIAVIPGDGIGPEVVAQGLKALRAAANRFGFEAELVHYDLGGERYLRTGQTLTDQELEELRRVDAIYLGAIGHPEVPPGVLERGVLLRLRFELDQYVNLRPVKLYPGVDCPLKGKGPGDIDFVVVRENTEGLYCGAGGFLRHGTPEEVAVQSSINTRRGVERCVRYAFELARRQGRRRVTLCAKTNVLNYASDLWRRTFEEVAREYPEVEADYAHVDALCMWMVRSPERFEVIVTDNMFGDIITDLGAAIQGGLGLAAGANINPRGVSMFEPIGGSAPKYAGTGKANPLAAICAVGLMLEHLGLGEAARRVEEAVVGAIGRMRGMDAGRMGMTTDEVGDLVARLIEEMP